VLNFVIVRFTHGAGGKFISSVLQTSDDISHWSATVQQSKKTPEFEELVREYTKRSFPINPKYHMLSEPIAPYNTDLYSSSYPRGNEVTLHEFLTHAREVNDTSLLQIIDSKHKCNLVFHKPNVPRFAEGADVEIEQYYPPISDIVFDMDLSIFDVKTFTKSMYKLYNDLGFDDFNKKLITTYYKRYIELHI